MAEVALKHLRQEHRRLLRERGSLASKGEKHAGFVNLTVHWRLQVPPKDEKRPPESLPVAFLMIGGADETRTRDLRRDRPAF